MTLIPDDHLHKICKLGQGSACCSYLGLMPDGMHCLKGTNLEAEINQRRSTGSIGAMGDNCPGLIIHSTIP